MTAPGAVIGVIGGRYRTGALLGRGGMAEVYDGFDERLQRPVAIKLLRREMAVRDDIRARFKAEALAAAGLSHPHAVAVYDTGEHDGLPFLVMERLPGDTLAERIADGPVDPAWVRTAASGVLGALAVAHGAGIVHRDVKPGNILLDEAGRAKITDFGIAKSVHPPDDSDGSGGGGGGDGRADLTGTGQLLGTPAYLAPERLEGKRATPRSDLWALGVVLYEALTGSKPFVGPTPLAVANAVVTGDHVPLDQARPGLDPSLVATVERAMAIDPDARFATAAEMAAALDEPPGHDTMVMPVVTPLATAPAPARARTRGPRPGLVWLVAGVVVAAAALTLGWAGKPGIPAASPSAAVTQPPTLVATMRALAGRLDPARDGARVADLAAGLRRVATDLDSQAAGTAGDAAGLIVSTGAWYRAGQLGESTTASALDLLRQVPGVSAQAAPATTVPTTVATVPASTDAPTTTAAPRRSNNNGNGNGDAKGKDNND